MMIDVDLNLEVLGGVGVYKLEEEWRRGEPNASAIHGSKSNPKKLVEVMRARDLHPLCCLPAADGGPPPPPLAHAPPAVAGLLYKWTNIGKGWRPRWFAIRGAVLAYSKIPRRSTSPPSSATSSTATRIIGHARYGHDSPVGLVHLKISSFRESKSDDRRFYLITPAKTLQLRTDSANERAAWIEALVSARAESSPDGGLLTNQNDASFSTERLRNRMHEEGLGEEIIKDCEQIVHSEFSQYHTQMKQRCEEYVSFLSRLPQQFEVLSADDNANMIELHSHLMKPDYCSSGQGKCSESSNTESSDDVGQQELDELLDDDDYQFYDTRQSFSDSAGLSCLNMKCSNSGKDTFLYGDKFVKPKAGTGDSECLPPFFKRRTKLPDPVEKEKSVSLWSMIKDNVGRDLTQVCLPVYFNEPLSSLQKCFEDLEYSYLLDRAYECGLKVSHHPMVMACHCEGKGWKFWGDSNVKSKFWGQTIQLDPVGVLSVEFDDGEIFQWSKVTTTINNVIIGQIYCNHYGTMSITGNRGYSCKLIFKRQSFVERNPRQVEGLVKDGDGSTVASLMGKWDERMYCSASGQNVILLWEKNEASTNPTRYNLSSFAITLNELTPELKESLPPTDSRLRPDQRHVENGEYSKANAEKLRLERRQRMSRKMQDNGWKPRWFRRDDDTFRYVGGYWEARQQRKWDGCHDIFGEFV
ncbi:Oxysterol-binding protein 1 [Zea mays]|uniref:Oxysterol-binding protein 1 n=1 Tax=Zea mays TaxID=4577 RepID=A0A1D6PM76_MAIZE|nr:Oxysterol-binding protein 1 [Zea mays]|eukprot:XP_008658033.1 putative oxysterol binding domain family protein isoform X2 [Zea mays]